MKFITIFVALAILFIAQGVHSREEPAEQYAPGKYVKRYGTKNAFPGDGSSEEYGKYFEKSAERPIAVIAFAVIAYCICMCINFVCCCCKPQSGLCAPREIFSKTPGKQICLLLLFCCLIIVLALVGVGFNNEDAQDDAIKSLPDVLDRLVQWADSAADAVTGLENATQELLTTIENLDEDAPPACKNNTYYKLLQESGQEINTELNADTGNTTDSLTKEIDEVREDMVKYRDDSQDYIDNVNDVRKQIMLAYLIVLLLVTLCSITIASLNAAEKCTQDSATCQCCTSSFILFIILLTMIVSAVVYLFVIVVGDFCYDPERILVEASEANSTEDLNYYLNCVDDPTLESPNNEYIIEINTEINKMNEYIDELKQQLPACLGNLEAQVDGLAYRATGEGEPYPKDLNVAPLLNNRTGIIGCYELNGQFQDFLFDVCKDFYDPFAIFWELFIVIGVFMLIAELISKLLMTSGDDGFSKAV
eukprot:m.332938 g.332938  ORF g.332938 m.332938 type:complete len:478 (-) comp17032_c0_seq1:53-1486(-)